MFSVKGLKVIKNISNILRLCHVPPGDTAQQNWHVLKTFDKTVDPFSKIYIETPMNVSIQPIDLHEHPNGDRLLLTILSRKVIGPSSEFSIKQSAKRVDVIGSKSATGSDAHCVIHAPVRASLDIQATGDSSIAVLQMHSDECSLKSASGLVKLRNIRGKSINVKSEAGSVVCEGSLQAENIDIRTESTAHIFCEHVRANTLKVATSGGNISTDSCYSDEAHFLTVIGNLKLRNVHSNCSIEVLKQGDITMTGLDGTINAILKRGNVHLQASKFHLKNSIFLHESGSVDIGIPHSFTDMSFIEVVASKLSIDEEILKHGKLIEDTQLQKFRYGDDTPENSLDELLVDCRNGSVDLKISSWKKMLQENGIKVD